MKKASRQETLSYSESVEEALCFGWIDSLPRKLDVERHLLLFTPRKPKSPWSKLNKSRIASLIESGKMTERGFRLIEEAKKDGSWSVYDEAEDLTEPEDLIAALNSTELARKNWDTFSPSSRKGILWWIKSAKSVETRLKRIEETTRMAILGLRANYPADKKKLEEALLRQSREH